MKIQYFITFHIYLLINVAYAQDIDTTHSIPHKLDDPHTQLSAEQYDHEKLKANKIYSFDTRSFFGAGQQEGGLIKISRWNSVPEGNYSLKTFVNGRYIGELLLDFKHLDVSSSAVLCIDTKLLALLDLKKEVLEKLPQKECLIIKELSPHAYYDYDQGKLSLNISLPLVITQNRPRGYIAPERFDRGVSAAYLSYQYSHYLNQREQFQDTTRSYLRLNAGWNFLGWNYKHTGYFDSEEAQLKKYHSSNHQLSTDLLKIRSRLTLGEFNTQTYSMDSANIRGIQIASDVSMLPFSQQSFAPKIQGMANTNAVVSVLQSGQKIYEQNVPAGLFEINDLSASAGSGDLTVQVTEQGGEKSSFVIPLQGSNNLIRVGQFNYSAAVGQYHFSQASVDELIAQLSMQYGISNALTVYGGSSYSQPFINYNFGTALNTAIGAFRLEAEHADAKQLLAQQSGQKYKLFYKYQYHPLKTYINLQTTYQTKDYISLDNVFSRLAYQDLNIAEFDQYVRTSQLKQQYAISLSQRLANEKWGSFYLNASKNQYWGGKNELNQLGLNYANSWRSLTYSFGMNKSLHASEHGQNETRYQFSLNLPIDVAKKRINLNSHIQQSDSIGEPVSASFGLSGSIGQYHQLSYSLSNNNIWNNIEQQSSIAAGINYNHSQFKLDLSSSLSDQDQQYGVNFSGGIVAHPYGLTLANQISDTFTIIHAEGAKGARVNNSYGGKIDHFGNAIYNHVSPYSENSIALDIRDLPSDVNLKFNQSEVIPRRYSSTMLKFITQSTSNIILNLQLKNGDSIPMGTQAKDKSANIMGYFGQSNQLFINNIENIKGERIIVWGKDDQNRCKIDITEQLLKFEKKRDLQIIDVECKP